MCSGNEVESPELCCLTGAWVLRRPGVTPVDCLGAGSGRLDLGRLAPKRRDAKQRPTPNVYGVMDGDPATIATQDLEPSVVQVVGGRGDAELIDAYEQHHDAVYGFLRRATRDADIAEDLLQEFARLLSEYRAGHAPEQVRAWLYRVAANLAISRGRRIQTAGRWLAGQRHVVDADRSASPETTVVRREWSSDVGAALATLPTESRSALLLAAQGYDGREIAAAIGRTEAATRTLYAARDSACVVRSSVGRRLDDRPSTFPRPRRHVDRHRPVDRRRARRSRRTWRAARHAAGPPTDIAIDAIAIASLPGLHFTPDRCAAVLQRVLGRRRSAHPMRMLLVAAIVAVLAAGMAVAVGGELMRRSRVDQLSVVPTAPPIETPIPSIPPAPTEAYTLDASDSLPSDHDRPSSITVGPAGELIVVGGNACVMSSESAEPECTAPISRADSFESGTMFAVDPGAAGSLGGAVSVSGPQLGITAVAGSADGYVAIGYADDGGFGITVWRQEPGAPWERLARDPVFQDARPEAVAATGSGWVIGGEIFAPDGPRAAIWHSDDGRVWRRVADGPMFDIGDYLDTSEEPESGRVADIASAGGRISWRSAARQGAVPLRTGGVAIGRRTGMEQGARPIRQRPPRGRGEPGHRVHRVRE